MKTVLVSTFALALAACTNRAELDPPPSGGGFGTGGSPTGNGFVGVAGAGGSSLISSSLPGSSLNEPVVVARRSPPPLAGGTLLVIAKGHAALVADPDHDQAHVVDLDRPSVVASIPLELGDEPGRAAEDAAGRVHLVLRGSGIVATLDAKAGVVLERRQVCAYPRGIAYDAGNDAVHVACAGGELVTLPAGGGAATRTLHLDLDLRDVVVDGRRLLVSRFRAAELLVVEPSGQVSARLTPPKSSENTGGSDSRTFAPAVAWRTIAAPGGGAIMVFQDDQTSPVVVQPGGYGGTGSCSGSIVQSSVALLRTDGTVATTRNLLAVLPVDVASDPSSSELVIAAAGSAPQSGMPGVITTGTPTAGGSDQGCGTPANVGTLATQSPGRVVAVGFDWKHEVVAQTREPSYVMVGTRAVALPGDSQKDTGHDLFHFGTAGGLACASCHPEGREDGHVWTFDRIGPRRTQSVGGGIMDTKPFHWDGDMTDFSVLAHEVFTSRMSGPELGFTQLTVMEDWIDRVPAWKPATASDPASVERGRTLFLDAKVACASCHAGAKLTNNTSANVGTKPAGEPGRGLFQVPSLIGVRWRAPFMHQGCAGTLADRFRPDCGGGDLHGHTSHLSEAERTDLTNYLSAL